MMGEMGKTKYRFYPVPPLTHITQPSPSPQKGNLLKGLRMGPENVSRSWKGKVRHEGHEKIADSKGLDQSNTD